MGILLRLRLHHLCRYDCETCSPRTHDSFLCDCSGCTLRADPLQQGLNRRPQEQYPSKRSCLVSMSAAMSACAASTCAPQFISGTTALACAASSEEQGPSPAKPTDDRQRSRSWTRLSRPKRYGQARSRFFLASPLACDSDSVLWAGRRNDRARIRDHYCGGDNTALFDNQTGISVG